MVHGLNHLCFINLLKRVFESYRRVRVGWVSIVFMLGMVGLVGSVGCLNNVGVERRSGFVRDRDVEVSQLVNRGVSELQQGRNVDAVESFERALALAPRSAPILNNLVVALMKAEDFSKAQARVTELESLEGVSDKSLFVRGDIAFASGDLDAAAQLYFRSAQLLGRDKGVGEDKGGSRAAGDLGLSDKAKHSDVFKRLVEVKFKQGAVQEAMSLMQEAEYHILKGAGRDEGEIARAILFAKIALGSGRFRDSASVFDGIFEAGTRDLELVKLYAVSEYYLGERQKFATLVDLLVEGEELNEQTLDSFLEKGPNINELDVTSATSMLSGKELLETISQFQLDGGSHISERDFDYAAEIVFKCLIGIMPAASQAFLPSEIVVKYGDFIKSSDETLNGEADIKGASVR